MDGGGEASVIALQGLMDLNSLKIAASYASHPSSPHECSCHKYIPLGAVMTFGTIEWLSTVALALLLLVNGGPVVSPGTVEISIPLLYS